jgi:2-polyprenyl-3-methyl-5-hydroxy-6-metoxy-1,4-benzoquinol methylase
MNVVTSTQKISEWVSPKEEWQSIGEYILFLKQSKAYEYVKPYCNDKCILDYGCGSGYGVMAISEHAKSVIGVDINKQIIDHCNERYKKVNVSFKQVNAEYPLPYENGVFDIIVSFQVIEHLPDVSRYLSELKRLLKDEGLLFIATPNRNYRLLLFEKPWNPEHIREYSYKSLNNELRRVFSDVKISGVHGNEKVDSIERKRVYRSPLKHLLWIILPKSVISSIQARRHKSNTSTLDRKQLIVGDTLLQKFSLTDFDIGEYTIRCLDLMAVCRK